MRDENKYEGLVRIYLLKYFVEIKPDHEKALEVLRELDQIVREIPDIQNQLSPMEYYRVKLHMDMGRLDYAQKYAEKLWYLFEVHSDEIFKLLTQIYKKLKYWE